MRSVVFRSCVLINLEYRHVGVCRFHCTRQAIPALLNDGGECDGVATDPGV